MIEALIDGEKDPRVPAELAQKRLRDKIPQLQRALEGEINDHHRFLLRRWQSFKIATTDSNHGHPVYPNLLAGLTVLDQYDFLEKEIARISERLGAIAPPRFVAPSSSSMR